jgi:hypothetical protein
LFLGTSFASLYELIGVFGFDSETAFLLAAPNIDALYRAVIQQATHRLFGNPKKGCDFSKRSKRREWLGGDGLMLANDAL